MGPFTIIQIITVQRIAIQTKCKIRIRIIAINIKRLFLHFMIVEIPEFTICCDIVSRFYIFFDNLCLHFTEMTGTL